MHALRTRPYTPGACRRWQPGHRRPHHGTARCSAARTQLTSASIAELDAEAGKLVQLAQAKEDKAAVEAQAEALERLAAAAGANTVDQAMNDGTFDAFTLTGRTAQRMNSVITIGLLSFNGYQPNDLQIKVQGGDAAGIFKGPGFGTQQAYVISTPFEVVRPLAAEPGGSAASSSGGASEGGGAGDEPQVEFTGIRGRSRAVGEYSQAPDNPQRLIIAFKKMRLEPVVSGPDELQRWLDTFLSHNPGMDAETGVLEVPLPDNSPQGWMDYLSMTPSFQLVRGNAGSKTLLRRSAA